MARTGMTVTKQWQNTAYTTSGVCRMRDFVVRGGGCRTLAAKRIARTFALFATCVCEFVRWAEVRAWLALFTGLTVVFVPLALRHLCISCFSNFSSHIHTCTCTHAQTHTADIMETRTATCSCRDPETCISFLVARWRPTQAASYRVCRRRLRRRCSGKTLVAMNRLSVRGRSSMLGVLWVLGVEC